MPAKQRKLVELIRRLSLGARYESDTFSQESVGGTVTNLTDTLKNTYYGGMLVFGF